jgi:hypothetical protein
MVYKIYDECEKIEKKKSKQKKILSNLLLIKILSRFEPSKFLNVSVPIINYILIKYKDQI